jgi:hypothetical protein
VIQITVGVSVTYNFETGNNKIKLFVEYESVSAVLILQIIKLFMFFIFGATAPIWALAYLHESLRFTSVF